MLHQAPCDPARTVIDSKVTDDHALACGDIAATPPFVDMAQSLRAKVEQREE